MDTFCKPPWTFMLALERWDIHPLSKINKHCFSWMTLCEAFVLPAHVFNNNCSSVHWDSLLHKHTIVAFGDRTWSHHSLIGLGFPIILFFQILKSALCNKADRPNPYSSKNASALPAMMQGAWLTCLQFLLLVGGQHGEIDARAQNSGSFMPKQSTNNPSE